MSTLSELSNDLSKVVQGADASIIRVEGRRRLPASGIAWSEDGIIVTAHHVVERNEDIKVGLPNGETVDVELVGRDPSTDIAVLRADAQLTVPNWGNIDDLGVGNLVLALGRPGNDVLATLGVVSALQENVPIMRWGWGGGSDDKSEDGEKRKRRGRRGWGGHSHWGSHGRQRGSGYRTNLEYFLQTDVVMYPGFSGGPLVGAEGNVYGLNTSALMRGVSTALTVPTLERVVSALLEHGRIPRGYLGVGVQTVDLPANIAEETEQSRGVMVVSVEPDSPAEQAGIILGDILIKIDDDAVENVEQLLGLLAGGRVGAEVHVHLLRAGELQTLGAVVGERD